jgi:hypothetical protein
MAEPLASMAQPDPWETARQWGGPAVLLALVGWLSRQFVAWRKRVKFERSLRRQERKDIRYLLDAQRQVIEAIVGPVDGRAIDIEELRRQHVLISEVREETWLADGHPPRQRQNTAAEVRELLTRTQAIQGVLERDQKAKTERFRHETETFKDGWRGEDS